MPNVIHQIVGNVIQTRDADDDPHTPKEIKEYKITPNAEIHLDGERRVKVAQLEIGDEVVIGNGSRDGFRFVEAKRVQRQTKAPPKGDDHSHPKILRLEEPEKQTVEVTAAAPPLKNPHYESNTGSSDATSADATNTSTIQEGHKNPKASSLGKDTSGKK